MRTLRLYKNTSSIDFVTNIVDMEDLDVRVEFTVDALGDSIIMITGDNEDIDILEQIYNMVK